jgi:hypothetical protein
VKYQICGLVFGEKKTTREAIPPYAHKALGQNIPIIFLEYGTIRKPKTKVVFHTVSGTVLDQH